MEETRPNAIGSQIPTPQSAVTPAEVERLFSLGRLTSGIIHELNNPLNAILMNAELGLLLLEKGNESAKLADVLRTIAQEARRAGILIQDLQSFVWADDFLPNEAAADLNDIIGSACRLLSLFLRRHKVEIRLDLDQHLPRLIINPMALTQAIANLIGNAVAAGASKIRIVSTCDQDAVCLHTIDNGMEIPAADIDKLFATDPPPIFTQNRSMLGLGLVQCIAKDHRGSLNAASGAGEGTWFTIRLPVNPRG